MKPIPEREALSSDEFHTDFVARGEPVVLRGLVRHWPMVAAARESTDAFCDYVRGFDRGYPVDTMHGPASIRGRMFYNDDLSGLNCRMEQTALSTSLDVLLENRGTDHSPTIAIQSTVISRYLPGLERDNHLPPGYVPEEIDPRLWLGGRSTVAAHYDPSENIACCVAGARRFTLFSPEQVANLYVGPFELTPAGAIISMVDFENPDYDAFPRFRDAEEAALVADLEPGDAVYVPYLWWHHVRSLDDVNGLVNYWWATRRDAWLAMVHAMMSLRALAPRHREAWHAMFEHYVFGDDDTIAAHLPESRRGILGELDKEELRRVRLSLSRALSRN